MSNEIHFHPTLSTEVKGKETGKEGRGRGMTGDGMEERRERERRERQRSGRNQDARREDAERRKDGAMETMGMGGEGSKVRKEKE